MSRRKAPALFLLILLLPLSLIAANGLPAHGQTSSRRGRGDAGNDGPVARQPFAKPGAPRQTERIRTFDVRHIKAELTLDPKKGEVRGTVTHTIAPLFPGLSEVTFDAAREMMISKVEVGPKGSTHPVGFSRKGDMLVVGLDGDEKPDAPFDVVITYSTAPTQGIYFIKPSAEHPDRPLCIWTQGESEETRHWLPCYDYPNDRATTEMIVTVAKPLSVLSNGALVETKDNGDGTTTAHWKMDTPFVSYLISLAVSEFAVYHDKAGTVPVDYYVLKGVDEATARRALGKTPRMISFFNDKIGTPYAYPKYAQVCVPEFAAGGMENVSATTLNDGILRDKTAYLEGNVDSLVAHELAHQWFGDLLTCREWSNIWLNEGFASYFDALYTEHDKGEDVFRLKMANDLRQYIRQDRGVRRAIVEDRFKDTIQMFDAVTYSKGACVLHALRGLIGDDAWWRGIKGYVASNKEQVVSTDDFRKAMEAASGRDLAWFFDQWVFHGGHPELKARWRYEPDDQTLRLQVEQTQTVDDLTPLFRLPTTVEIGNGSEVRSVNIVIDGKAHEFVIPSPTKPSLVRIDPKGWLPKVLDFEKPTEEWVNQLEHDQSAFGRVEAANALAKRKSEPAATSALSRVWSHEAIAEVRLAILKDVAEAGEPCRTALVEAARDRDARVRVAALDGLSKLNVDSALENLFRSAWSNRDEAYGVRIQALRALLNARMKLKPRDREELIASALNDPSDDHAIAAEGLRALLDEGGAQARETAVRYSRPGQPTRLRREAIDALGKLARNDPQAETLLKRLVDDPSRPIMMSAFQALTSGGFTSALPLLEERLSKVKGLSRMVLEPAIESLRKKARGAGPETAREEVGRLERQANELELQARELHNRAEALKLKNAREKLAPRAEPAS